MLPTTLAILGLGGEEIALILVIIVVFFGAAKIPELARSMGRAKGEYARGVKEGEQMAREASIKDAAPIEQVDEDRVRKAAAQMGIPTEGRPLSDIKADMRARMG